MYRFVQELNDHEQSEAEMRKMKEDLDRRIHDQKLVVDIFNIPDQQWEKDAHNFHHPYHATMPSSSSSKELANSEFFRLYFKGLVSEEMVKGMMVNVAGAGVAICDLRDNLILESRKNLEALVNGVVVSSEVAKLHALIKALNKALPLDLKSVTFLCDDYMLYQQYVSQ